LLCVDVNPDSAESDESPERSEDIDDSEDIEEIVEASVEESAEAVEPASDVPSSAERVSNPVVLASPKSAVAVSPVPTVLLDDFFSLFLLLASLVFPEPESVGMETDGIDGDDISGIETEGMLVCANNVPPPMFAINRKNTPTFSVMQLRKLRMILQVRKAFIYHLQTRCQL
jgi:hypothetical protein